MESKEQVLSEKVKNLELDNNYNFLLNFLFSYEKKFIFAFHLLKQNNEKLFSTRISNIYFFHKL